ncbi:hypothetical protein JCGZ_22365 [Jatropha curcas]|uniref:AMP-dependent synthetase/ligase domain-containing protein n=1 Tax=Jatropha curcas TaxID=180498 RepID=A0A067L963_JATCU|nr:hypothetical protein JCGZ_22365 [Jatropha curcas]
MEGLVQCSANYLPLTPVSFLERAATVYGDKTSIIYGTVRFSWAETYERCLKVASALVQLEISHGDVVAILAPNIPALYELHFSVPMAGAILSALNTSVDATTLAFMLQQLNAKLFFVDYQCLTVALQALDILSSENIKQQPKLILIPEFEKPTPSTPSKHKSSSTLDYIALLQMGNSDFEVIPPKNECDPISVSFTSGSTGNPKGVIYSHRAAYLNSLADIFRCDMRERLIVFLWTLDMFRCNGWCLTWAMAAIGGTNICLRNVSAEVIFEAIILHKVTHLCGPPTILNVIANALPDEKNRSRHKVNVIVAGGLLNTKILLKVEELGFNVIDGYGMTEALGPAIVQPLKLDSASSNGELQNPLMEGVDVKDPNTMKSVPYDGKTLGEVMFKSNILMSGYLKNTEATQEAFNGGWYHTGDVGVRHPNGSIQMKDRAKDIIVVNEGEIISTLEVEAILLSHPKILRVAVIGKSDDGLKEVVLPCAFVKLKDGFDANAQEIIQFCSGQLPNYMVPKSVIFGDLPINFTGKVQKFVLREKVNAINIANCK